MFYNIFGPEKPAQTNKKEVPATKKSHKMKNTYEIKVNGILVNHGVFAGMPTMNLAIAKENGVVNNSDWIECKEFPNPMASELRANYASFSAVMGAKKAATIIEYLDKQTNKPVALMFPDGTVYVHDGYEENFLSAMNHATRRDFKRQLKMHAQAMAAIEQLVINQNVH